MAMNSTNLMMTVGASLNIVTGVAESIHDIKDLFINPASELAMEIKMNDIGKADSLVVINGPEDYLMGLQEWRLEKYNYDKNVAPLEYLKPGEFAKYFGTKGKFCLIGRDKDIEQIRQDVEEFSTEYLLDHDRDDIGENEPEENEAEPSEEENKEENDDTAAFVPDEDDSFDDSEPAKKRVKSDRAGHHQTKVDPFFGAHGDAEPVRHSECSYEDEYRTKKEETENRKEETEKKEKKRAADAREWIDDRKGGHISSSDSVAQGAPSVPVDRIPEKDSAPSSGFPKKDENKERKDQEECQIDGRSSGKPCDRMEHNGTGSKKKDSLERSNEGRPPAAGHSGTQSSGENDSNTHGQTRLETIRRDREERRKNHEEFSASSSFRGRSVNNRAENGFKSDNEPRHRTEEISFSSVQVRHPNNNPDSAWINPVPQAFDGMAGQGDSLQGQAVGTAEAGNLRYYSTVSVLNNSNIQRGMQTGGYLLSEMLIPRDIEAGRVTHNAVNIAVPIGEIAVMSAMRNGAVKLNNNTVFNERIYAAALKNGSQLEIDQISTEIKSMLESIQGESSGGVVTMHQINQYLMQKHKPGFIRTIMGMDPDHFRGFLADAGISNDFRNVMLSIRMEHLLNQDTYKRLESAVVTAEDREFLAMLKGSFLEGKYGRINIGTIIKGSLRRESRHLVGRSEGVSGLYTSTYLGRVVKTAYKTGMKGITKAAKANGASNETIKRLVIAQSPIKHVKEQGIKVTKDLLANKGIDIKVGTKLTNFLEAAFGTGTSSGNAAAGAAAGTTALGAGAEAGAASGATGVAAGTAAGGSAAGTAGGAAAGGAVAGGATVGVIVAIVLLLFLVVFGIFQQTELKKKQQEYQPPSAGGYMYIQNTEIIDEVNALLTQKNTAFITEINTTAQNRSGNAYRPSFAEGVDLSFYESGGYAVVFRDFEGNLLEPNTVDLNNTKAILAMASKYIPYPFTKLAENASQQEKNDYEQAKQYFIDYCSYLWASTHQVSIEEYHPGDVNFADYDDTGLQTNDEGQCDENGTKIWLPDNFIPNEVNSVICDDCDEKPNTGLGEYGDALCTNGKGKNEHDGWRLTGAVKTHYNCPGQGHYVCTGSHWESEYTGMDGTIRPGYWEDDYEYVHCGDSKHNGSGEVWLCDELHKHTCYEWIYECGAHMGSVVYVTVGDLSRIPSLPPAGDVDYSVVGQYP